MPYSSYIATFNIQKDPQLVWLIFGIQRNRNYFLYKKLKNILFKLVLDLNDSTKLIYYIKLYK